MTQRTLTQRTLFDASPVSKVIRLKESLSGSKKPFKKYPLGLKLFNGNYSQFKKNRAQ